MKKLIACVLLVALLICGCAEKAPESALIGTPGSDNYDGGRVKARNPWDIAVFDGVLYVGSGDYDKNTGPVTVMAYDIKNNKWFDSGVLQDEAVSRFLTVNGKLTAPGIDPKAEWDYGNYYVLADGEWTTIDNVPGGVHMFDIAEFGGKIFYGLGTGNNYSAPVKVSADNGQTYENVSFYRDGARLIGNENYTYFRVYDFFLLGDTLYCTLNAYKESGSVGGIFRYDGEAFQFYGESIYSCGLSRERLGQVPLGAKQTYGESLYVANGALFRTDNLTEFTEIALPDGSSTTDLLVEDDTMYILSKLQNEDKTYKTTIWKYVSDTDIQPLYSFDYDLGGLSFAKNKNDFYVGIGEGNSDNWNGKGDVIGDIFEIKNVL